MKWCLMVGMMLAVVIALAMAGPAAVRVKQPQMVTSDGYTVLMLGPDGQPIYAFRMVDSTAVHYTHVYRDTIIVREQYVDTVIYVYEYQDTVVLVPETTYVSGRAQDMEAMVLRMEDAPGGVSDSFRFWVEFWYAAEAPAVLDDTDLSFWAGHLAGDTAVCRLDSGITGTVLFLNVEELRPSLQSRGKSWQDLHRALRGMP